MGATQAQAGNYLRPIDYSAFAPDNFDTQLLYMSESVLASAIRIPPGCAGPDLHVHTSDQIYYALNGMNLELDGEQHVAEPDTLVVIPAGVSHRTWNEGPDAQVSLELLLPGIPAGRPILTPAKSNAAKSQQGQLIHITSDGFGAPAPSGARNHPLVDDSKGSQHAKMHIAQLSAGAAAEQAHLHRTWDQCFFILEGTLQLQIGLDEYEAQPHTLVVLPANVPHSNYNKGPGVESHLACSLGVGARKEPAPGASPRVVLQTA